MTTPFASAARRALAAVACTLVAACAGAERHSAPAAAATVPTGRAAVLLASHAPAADFAPRPASLGSPRSAGRTVFEDHGWIARVLQDPGPMTTDDLRRWTAENAAWWWTRRADDAGEMLTDARGYGVLADVATGEAPFATARASLWSLTLWATGEGGVAGRLAPHAPLSDADAAFVERAMPVGSRATIRLEGTGGVMTFSGHLSRGPGHAVSLLPEGMDPADRRRFVAALVAADRVEYRIGRLAVDVPLAMGRPVLRYIATQADRVGAAR